jgi:hypothetical protein
MENHDERGNTFYWQKLRLWRSGDHADIMLAAILLQRPIIPLRLSRIKKPLAVPHSVPKQNLNTNKSILTTSRRAVIFVRHRPMCGDYSTLGTDRTARRLFGPGRVGPGSGERNHHDCGSHAPIIYSLSQSTFHSQSLIAPLPKVSSELNQ